MPSIGLDWKCSNKAEELLVSANLEFHYITLEGHIFEYDYDYGIIPMIS